MKIIVVGAGRVGSSLAKRLVGEGHEVSIIDKSLPALTRLEDEGITASLVSGLGFDLDTLAEAGAEDADVIVGATDNDNVNLLSVQVARGKFGVKRIVARVHDPKRASLYEQEYDIDVVCETIPTIQELSAAVGKA